MSFLSLTRGLVLRFDIGLAQREPEKAVMCNVWHCLADVCHITEPRPVEHLPWPVKHLLQSVQGLYLFQQPISFLCSSFSVVTTLFVLRNEYIEWIVWSTYQRVWKMGRIPTFTSFKRPQRIKTSRKLIIYLLLILRTQLSNWRRKAGIVILLGIFYW